MSLNTVLFLLLLYGAVGLLPLYWAKHAINSFQLLLSRLFLIFYAAFMLTIYSFTMSFAETLSKEDLPDLAQFKNNILMLGFVYTFLFGGVGTNIISSVIISSKVDKVIDRLSRIEEILNEQKKASNVSNPKVSNRVLLYANGLVFVAMVTILLFSLA